MEMVERKAWKEFRDAKLLWFVNRILHLFGWAIVFDFSDDGNISEVYPARVKFRGFGGEQETEGFIGLSEYLKNNIDTLLGEAKD